MRNIQDYNFQGKKALIRVDFNVPVDNQGHIADTTRIDKTLPTIRKVLSDGGAVILLSHLGRPQRGDTTFCSLQQLVPYLQGALGNTIFFSKDCVGADATLKAKELQEGQVLLLENVRFHTEEEKGDPAFAQALASLGDVYVNDAFGTVHRKHASTYTITQYMQDKMAGYLLQEETNNANKLLSNICRPFTVIIGGTKIADKLPVMETLLNKLDTLLIGGGIANTFHQALGGAIGDSIVEPSQHEAALNIFHKAIDLKKDIVLPVDVLIADRFSNQAHTDIVRSDDVSAKWMTVDIGPTTQDMYKATIQKSQTILWTGPIGAFEIQAFSKGTQVLLEAVAKATQNGAFSLIGGGDSATAVAQFGYKDKVSYVSTGGGALLAYLADPSLPAIKALNE
jgi:phosphoglycerate kinase